MTPPDALTFALIAALLLCSYLAWWANACRCPKCGIHVKERADAIVRQREMAHDAEHKGFGWKNGDPDTFRCHSDYCDRNPKE